MATTRKKVSVKKATTAKSAAKKAVKKAPVKKATPKKPARKSVKAKNAATLKKKLASSAKAGKPSTPKRVLPASTKAPGTKKAAAAKVAKKVVKKAAVKAPVRKTATKAAAKKVVAKAAPKPAEKKTAAKAPVKSTPKVLPKALTRSIAAERPTKAKTAKAAAETAPKPALATPASQQPAPQAARALKALKGMGGALGARIAQIVAESALPKPVEAAEIQNDAVFSRSVEVAGEPGPLEVAHKAAAILFSKKAENVVLLDLRTLSTVADYYLICTCQNEPQMRAMLSGVQRALSKEGIKSLRSEYMSGVRWAIIDYGDLIIHLFEAATRGFYSLERLWADAPSTTLKAEDFAVAGDEGADEDDDL
jgi:ribosome silencing factor RsfS/YbeB/iojap